MASYGQPHLERGCIIFPSSCCKKDLNVLRYEGGQGAWLEEETSPPALTYQLKEKLSPGNTTSHRRLHMHTTHHPRLKTLMCRTCGSDIEKISNQDCGAMHLNPKLTLHSDMALLENIINYWYNKSWSLCDTMSYEKLQAI